MDSAASFEGTRSCKSHNPTISQSHNSAIIERVSARFGERTIVNDGIADKAVVAATGFHVRRLVAPGMSLFDFSLPVAEKAMEGVDGVKAVIAASFSSENRFPALSVRLATALGLASSTIAFDLQMACSAYPYAIYLASRIAADMGGRVLVVDADIQSNFVDSSDSATALVMDDAATATIVSCATEAAKSLEGSPPPFAFYSAHSNALECGAAGPIRMDGFKVFSFVARDVVKFLRPFGNDFDMFVPHRANLYMVRQLAKSLGLADKLIAPDDARFANPGSASIPATLALAAHPGTALIAGFGAGLSASAALVSLPDNFTAAIIP